MSAMTDLSAVMSALEACLASTTYTRGAMMSSAPNDVCSDVTSDVMLAGSFVRPVALRCSDVAAAMSACVPTSRMRAGHSCVPAKPASVRYEMLL